MSMFDINGPYIGECEVKSEFPSGVGYVPYIGDGKIIVQMVLVDKIYGIYSSHSSNLIDQMVEVSFYKPITFPSVIENIIKRYYKNQEHKYYRKVSLNKPIYSSDYYSIYNPEDKINLNYVFKTEDEAREFAAIQIEKLEFKNYGFLFN